MEFEDLISSGSPIYTLGDIVKPLEAITYTLFAWFALWIIKQIIKILATIIRAIRKKK